MSSKNLGIPDGEVLAQFQSYRDAVSFVERLIDNDFPARAVSIIGSDLKSVEIIRGRLGYGRVSLSGAITGSWIGMLFGLIIGGAGISSEQALFENLGAGVIIGAGVGMLLNILRFSVSRNKRNFISGQSVVAKKYQVVVPKDQLQSAKNAAKPQRPKAGKAKKAN